MIHLQYKVGQLLMQIKQQQLRGVIFSRVNHVRYTAGEHYVQSKAGIPNCDSSAHMQVICCSKGDRFCKWPAREIARPRKLMQYTWSGRKSQSFAGPSELLLYRWLEAGNCIPQHQWARCTMLDKQPQGALLPQ